MALPADMKSGSREALAWALAKAEAEAEASALGLTVAGSGPTANDRKARRAVAAANLKSHPHFCDRPLADELGITLATVKATGMGGKRILKKDIRAAAGLVPDPVAQSVAAAAPMARLTGFAASGPRSANPEVQAAHHDKPGQAVKAAAKGPEPQMFAAGALPAFTASGVDPAILASLPANARHHVAQLGTAAEAFAACEEFVGMSDQDAMVHASAAGMEGDDYRYYLARVSAWMTAGMSENDVWDAIGYRDPTTYQH
jgi:hypothetical protein